MREGIDVIRNTPVVRRITVTTVCWNLAFYGAEALVVPFLRDVIDLDGLHVGWVLGLGSLIGIVVAAGNVWAFFIQWLSLLGILVPPIGAIILIDQYMLRPDAGINSDWRPAPFIAVSAPRHWN